MVMTCSATTALGHDTRQPPGNAQLLNHRGRSVRAVDVDAYRRDSAEGPLPGDSIAPPNGRPWPTARRWTLRLKQ